MSWLMIAVAVMLAVAALALFASTYAGNSGQRLRGRLAPAAGKTPVPDAVETRFRRLADRGRQVERWFRDDSDEAGRLLVRAGWRSAAAQNLFYVMQAGLPAIAVVIVSLAWLGFGKPVGLQLLLLAFMGFAVGVLAPRFALRYAAAERQQRIAAEVPVFINIMVLLLEAGLTTRQALQSLVRDGGNVLRELADEFRLALRQIEAGGDLGEVLQAMSRTHDVHELSGVLGVLRQIERYGGQVREPLLAALATVEEGRGLALRERVNLLSGRMTILMVLFFFPALLVCVAGPAFTAIFKALAIR